MTSSQGAHTPDSWGKLNAWLILLCGAGLLAIWPLPGTIALRHAFLGIGFIASVYSLYRDRSTLLHRQAWPFWLLMGVYGWLLIHLAFFSHEWDLQMAELSSLWLRVLLAIPLGLSLGLLLGQISDRSPSTYSNKKVALQKQAPLFLFLGLLGTFAIFFCRYLYEVHITHQWLHLNFYFIPFKSKPPFVITSALLLPLCFILITRALDSLISKRWIALAFLGVALALFGNYFSNTKNGMAIFAVFMVLLAVRYLFTLHWNAKRIFLGAPILILILLMSSYGISKHFKQNTAWPNLITDISLASDIDHQQWWKNDKICCAPINSLGVPVDVSTYQRTAWFIAGVRLLAENPQGYGLVHHSFGSLAAMKWPDFSKPLGNMRGATHSAWLDFALAVGIPGLLLVLIPLWVSWYRSLSQAGLWASYTSWTIPVLTFAYLITEANEAHFIELLFFMVAFFCGLAIQYPVKKKFRSHLFNPHT